jgi:hypothetical protein
MSGIRRLVTNKGQRDTFRKKRVLEHADRIGNVRKACLYFGDSKSSFYLWKKAYEVHREEGLVNRRPCPVNPKLRPAERLHLVHRGPERRRGHRTDAGQRGEPSEIRIP